MSGCYVECAPDWVLSVIHAARESSRVKRECVRVYGRERGGVEFSAKREARERVRLAGRLREFRLFARANGLRLSHRV